MILIIIYVIISYLLDGLISNYIPTNLVNPSYLRTIYSIISLVIIYHYFENYKKYFYITISLGFLFDIVYTNTFPLNTILFPIISIIIKQLDYFLPNNILTINILSLLSIYIYHITTYFILLLTHYNSYTINLLLMILLRSTIMTIIYTTISYFVMRKIYQLHYNKPII